MSVIFTQVANLIGRRLERRSGFDARLVRNSLIVVGVSLEMAFAVAALYWPPLARILGTGPVPPQWVAFAALGAPLFFLADLLAKRLRTAVR